MPVRQIKTTLSLDGEKKFKQELADASRQMRVMNSELKAMASEFESTNDAQTYFTRRSETMNQKVKQQEEIVSALERALKEMGDSTKYSARQMDDYTIRLNSAKTKLFEMKREAEAAERELEDLGRDSNKIGRQIETGIGDAAEDVSEKLDGMFDKVASDISALKGSVAWQTTMSVGEFVMDGIQSVVSFVDQNMDYNLKLAQTKQNIKSYGLVWEDVEQLWLDIQAVTGNADGAFEAINNLAAVGFGSNEQMAATVRNLLGVYLSSGGALSVESLAETFLESVKTQTPTGAYAEALEKFTKRQIEDLQKAFSEAVSVSDIIELANAPLTEAGMQTKYSDYVETNKDLDEYQKKQAALTLAWAGLAEEIAPIVTGLIDTMANSVESVTAFAAWGRDFIEKNAKEIEEFKNIFLERMISTIPGAEAITGAIGAVDFVSTMTSETGQQLIDLFKQAYEEAYGGNNGVIDKIMDWLIPSAGAAEIPPEYGEYGAQAFSAFENGMQTAANESTAGADAANALVSDMESANGNAQTAGKNAMIYYANGIADGAPYVYRNVQTVMDEVNSILNSAAVPSWGGGVPSTSGGANPNTTVSERETAVLQIDGQTAGRLLYRGVSSEGARKVKSTMIVK